MSFEIEGKLHKKFEIENKTSTFQAREFVIETDDGGYTQYVKFQLVQDRVALIDSFQEGERIKVHFDLRGREWNGKYFTNLNAWRVEKAGEGAPIVTDGGGDASFPSLSDEPVFTSRPDDDLPF